MTELEKAENKAMLFERLLYSDLDNIPGSEGWWKQDTRVSFQRAGQKMMEAGMPIEIIMSLLHDLYWATASEFGG